MDRIVGGWTGSSGDGPDRWGMERMAGGWTGSSGDGEDGRGMERVGDSLQDASCPRAPSLQQQTESRAFVAAKRVIIT
jgi:hypothetical protein